MNELKENVKIEDKLKSLFWVKKCAKFAKSKSKSIIAAGLAERPTLLCNSASILFCSAVNTLLLKIWMNIPAKNMTACCLNKDYLTDIIDNKACKILVIIRKK